MKKEELSQCLRELGIPAYLYNLEDEGRTDERFCLKYVDNQWRVYFCERGIKTMEENFTSEEAACEYIYQQFLN